MRQLFTFLLCFFIIAVVKSQNHFTDFEDGTLQNWTNIDGSTTGMIVAENTNSKYLQKTTDGSNFLTGKMVIKNIVNFNGNYVCDNSNGIDCLSGIEASIKNDNNFDLHLRLGLRGANGTELVSTNSYIISANSEWEYPFFSTSENHLTVVNGTGTIEETKEDIQEIRIIHNPLVSFDGASIMGALKIEEIYTLILLSNNDQLTNRVAIFPNPTTNSVVVQLPSEKRATITVYNVLGKQLSRIVSKSKSTIVSFSELSSGVYYMKVEAENSSITKKVVKL